MDRRSFLKTGLLAGSTTLIGTSLYGCADLDILETELVNDDVSVALAALIPVFLSGVLPDDGPQRQNKISEVVAGIRIALKKLPPHTLKELDDLFMLLTNRLTMLAYAGQFAPLHALTHSQATMLIEGWRNSFIGLLNTAYEGLKELVFAAYYGNPENWAALNYQKPNLGV